jgi:hypothetical protein
MRWAVRPQHLSFPFGGVAANVGKIRSERRRFRPDRLQRWHGSDKAGLIPAKSGKWSGPGSTRTGPDQGRRPRYGCAATAIHRQARGREGIALSKPGHLGLDFWQPPHLSLTAGGSTLGGLSMLKIVASCLSAAVLVAGLSVTAAEAKAKKAKAKKAEVASCAPSPNMRDESKFNTCFPMKYQKK